MKDVIICRCEEVTLNQIEAAIRNGAGTPRDVKLVTRACMGICQGRTCRRQVEQLFVSMTEAPVPAVTSLTYRPPVRPVLLRELSSTPDKERN